MQPGNLIALAHTTIDAPSDKVWDALVNPEKIEKYMFGATVISDWKEGSNIVWKGEWKGKPYEDKGTVLELKPGTKLRYTHYSPMNGEPDIPENYHTITVELTDKGRQTMVLISQDNNPNDRAKEHAEQNWTMMLTGLKKLLEDNDY